MAGIFYISFIILKISNIHNINIQTKKSDIIKPGKPVIILSDPNVISESIINIFIIPRYNVQ